MRQFEVWYGDEYIGIFWEDELWLLEGQGYTVIDVSQ